MASLCRSTAVSYTHLNLIGGIVLGYIWQFIFSRVLVDLNSILNLPIFAKSWLSSPQGAFAAMVIVTDVYKRQLQP